MCTSLLINNYTRKSFYILADDSSMNDHIDDNSPSIANNKIKSIYHQNCIVPNEDFSILYNSIASKLQQPLISAGLLNKNSYSPSKDFFKKVSSKLRDLRPNADVQELTDQKMERPMFITTVKTGTFLEPPPEVAALLGLRKNSYGSNTGSSTSSTGKAQNGQNRNVIYSFASKPRILKSNLQSNIASRSLFRSENKREKREILNELPKISNDTSDGTPQYGNTMYDRRVARGSNFASQRPNVISTEHILSRQAEARRRAAVRQRAQIRARKLLSGTPPPVDGRRHGQIQTDKYLEELTERPPDKSIACQADLAVEHNSPVPRDSPTGVDAETQIYTGDLPDFDEIPSVITSIVNKILQEAILEINEEIQVIRLQNISSEKRRRANTLTKEDNGVITKHQLNGLLQQAIDELKNSEYSSADKNLDQLDKNQLLEKIFAEIKNKIFDVKFLTGIIKTQIENWPEATETNQPNEESDKAESISDREEYDNASNAETNDNAEVTDLRKEPQLTVESEVHGNDEENEEGDEHMEPMNVENDDYKTDDFQEENKDLARTEDNDNDTNGNPGADDDFPEESKDLVETEDKDEGDTKGTSSVDEKAVVSENVNPSTQVGNKNYGISQQDEKTIDTGKDTESSTSEVSENKATDDGDSVQASKDTNEAVVQQNENSNIEIEQENQDQPSPAIDQNTTEVPITTESSKEDQREKIDNENQEKNLTPDGNANDQVDNTVNQAVETSKQEITDGRNDNAVSTNNKDDVSHPSIEITEVVSQNANESAQEDVASLLDPPVNDTPEHDIVITNDEFSNQNEENSLNEIPEAINKSNDDPENVTSMLDPPVNDTPTDDEEDATTTEEPKNPDARDPNEENINSGRAEETTNSKNSRDTDNSENFEKNSSNQTDDKADEALINGNSSTPETTVENEANKPSENSSMPESDIRPKETTDTESVTTSEDDNDVIAVKPVSTEQPDSEGQPTSGVIPDEVQDTIINEMPDDAAPSKDSSPRTKTKPINDNDNISSTGSLSTNPSRETLNMKNSDTESVENNELQSNDDGANKEDLTAQTNDRPTSEKPSNTENIAEANSNQSDSTDIKPMRGSQLESTNNNVNDASNNNTESTNGPEYKPANDPNSQDVSEDGQDAEHDNQQSADRPGDSSIEKQNGTSEFSNQRADSAGSRDDSPDTNNNDTIKRPTIVVQNGSAVANR